MDLALKMRLRRIVVETDSEMLYKRCLGKEKVAYWKVEPYVQDCFEEVKWSKVNTSTNKAVDWLANQVKKKDVLIKLGHFTLSSLVHILNRDGFPTPPVNIGWIEQCA